MAFAGFEGRGFPGRVVCYGGFGKVGGQIGRGVVTERGVEFGKDDFAGGEGGVFAQEGFQSGGAAGGGRG